MRLLGSHLHIEVLGIVEDGLRSAVVLNLALLKLPLLLLGDLSDGRSLGVRNLCGGKGIGEGLLVGLGDGSWRRHSESGFMRW